MGLKIHAIGQFPDNVTRDYYIYLLDYGWKGPISKALYNNFDFMAKIASENNAVVIQGPESMIGEFSNEVLSWHRVNGRPGDELLPGILITTLHPNDFRAHGMFPPRSRRRGGSTSEESMIFVPLKNICNSVDDVISVINSIFSDVASKKPLKDFDIAYELKQGEMGALHNALVLKPNVGGIGVDFNFLIDFLRGKMKGKEKS